MKDAFKESPSIKAKSGRVIRVITTPASKSSRDAFDKLNTHRARGSVRVPDFEPTSTIIKGGADTDIVNTIFGGVTDQVISDGGGRRMSGAKIHVVFWGTEWLSNPPPDPSLDDVLSDIESILAGPYLNAAAQYGLNDTPEGFASFADAWIEHRGTPSYEFTMVDVNYEAWLMMTSGPISDGSNTVVCVVMPPGATPREALTGQHDRSLQPNLNWVPTMWVKFDSRARMSRTFSHELVETVTDPDGDGIQVEPTGIIDWHEIGDVCENIPGVLNGVAVQSYWSAEDNACVIPSPVDVAAWQIQCVHKRGARDNPNENIDKVGGIHIPSGRRFWMLQTDAIKRIENGDAFFVQVNGRQARVIVRTHYPPWGPQGIKFITTVADDTKENNLLSLPDCGRLDLWNS